MRFCQYCGKQISNDGRYCPECGSFIGERSAVARGNESPNQPVQDATGCKQKKRGTLLAIILGVVAIAIFLIANNADKCEISGCNRKVVSDMSYCYSHKCAVSSCDRSRFAYSNYCYSHYLVYDDDAGSSNTSPVYSYELKISNVKLSSNSSYTIVEGKLTNNSDQTVSFVKIKGAFKNSSGQVLDTDWTYAVGSEGLEPGESCTWRMSVTKDYSIKDCTVSILDYDY